MTEYHYRGQPLSSLSLWELGLVEKSIKEAEAVREATKDHPRLVKRNLVLPSPNPEFLKLKEAIENEIKSRQGIKNA